MRSSILGSMKSSLFLGLIFSSQALFAGLGRPIQNSTIPDGVCKLTLSLRGEEFHCTGSLVSPNLVKTAGHCLEKSELVSVECKSGESLSVISVDRFPGYDHQLIRREENRWVDHALIEVRDAKTTPLELVQDQKRFNELKPQFEECLLSGYGLNENPSLGTGTLKGVRFSPQTLEIRNNLIYAKGAYHYELLPGDSGGPLLCRAQAKWYDLGTASAHDWSHNSLYAPNFKVQKWFKNFSFSSPSMGNALPTRPIKKPTLPSIEIGKTYGLFPYSEIQTKQGSRYNGDMKNLNVEIIETKGQSALVRVKGTDSSRFFLCGEGLICYGEIIEGYVSLYDLIP